MTFILKEYMATVRQSAECLGEPGKGKYWQTE